MIRQARAADIDAVMQIIEATIIEMHAYGNRQWDKDYPQRDDFLGDIQEGSLYVYEKNGDIGGFVTLNTIEPDEYQGLNWSSEATSLVVHRMAVAPHYRRQGIGGSLLDFAAAFARQHGLTWLKTDTYSLNPKMNALFTQNGYRKIGEMSFNSRELPFYCYEKPVASAD